MAISAKKQNSPFDRLLIAVIEDNRDDYIIIERMLRRPRLHDIASIHFETVFKAQSWLSRNTPDLIITDYMIDGVGEGVGLISTLAETGVQAPVITITGAKDDSIDLEALNAGAYDYLDKSSLNAAVAASMTRAASVTPARTNA
jgi:DNA-binding NtrC family response regulator